MPTPLDTLLGCLRRDEQENNALAAHAGALDPQLLAEVRKANLEHELTLWNELPEGLRERIRLSLETQRNRARLERWRAARGPERHALALGGVEVLS